MEVWPLQLLTLLPAQVESDRGGSDLGLFKLILTGVWNIASLTDFRYLQSFSGNRLLDAKRQGTSACAFREVPTE